jgi:diadenylate cyclase
VLEAIREFFDTYLGSWTSLVDILIVAIVIYWIFILIRGTRAVRIVIGLSILYLVYLVAQLLQLRLLSTLLQTGAVVGLFAVVVVFQPELRRALEQIGRVGSVNRFFVSHEVASAERVAREISRAARLLAGS